MFRLFSFKQQSNVYREKTASVYQLQRHNMGFSETFKQKIINSYCQKGKVEYMPTFCIN